jgi:hypothetical protein
MALEFKNLGKNIGNDILINKFDISLTKNIW